ncbi:MAG: DUF4129 domain-containing protein [Microthrixaceae bacterium]
MSRPEFQYPKSIMERVGDWIAEQLNRIFDRGPSEVSTGSTFSGGVGTLIGWVILALAVAAVIVIVVLVVRRWVPKHVGTAEETSEVEIEHRRTVEWSRQAQDHESRGEWKLAMRKRYRELVRRLVDRGQVADLAGRTTGELLTDIEFTTPAAVEDFTTACLLFELPWYADVAHLRGGETPVSGMLEAVLGAPSSSRWRVGRP